VRLFKTILALMLIVGAVPTAIVGWMSASDTRELLVRSAQELAQERVEQLRLKAHAALEEPTRTALGLPRIPGFMSLPQPEQRSHLAAILNRQREITALTLFDKEGRRLPGLQAFAAQEVAPTELVEHQTRAAALLDEHAPLRYSEVYLAGAHDSPRLTLTFPIGAPLQGYGAAEVSLAPLAALLGGEQMGTGGLAYLVDERGRRVAGTEAEWMGPTADLSRRPAVAHWLEATQLRPGQGFHVGNFGEGEGRIVAAYAALPEQGWAVVFEQPLERAYSEVATLRRRLGAGLLVAIAVALALSAIFSRSVTRPLKGFTAGALELAKGKFGVQVTVKKRNELGELASTFNYMSQQLAAYDQETKRLYESLEKGYLETIVALANSIDSKDPYTRGHSQRVGETAVEIGRELGLNEHELRWLRYGGILHDVGKIGIIESILRKQTRLTDEEMVVMREHPEIGDTIVSPITFLAPVRAAIRNHHERWDGKGYPDGLAGDAIPLAARIVNCADTFDACTSTRPYQKAMPLEQALEIMERLRGSQLDPSVLDALRRVVQKKGVLVEGQRGPVRLLAS
jgi:HD-GYP domain-containing protein (c-di-GMP phosphodiesterase class II)